MNTLAALLIAATTMVAPAPAPLPVCQYEDGNTNGSACMWTDPDTSTRYVVTSDNYK